MKETTITRRRLSALLAATVVAATATLAAGPADAAQSGKDSNGPVGVQGLKNGYNGYGDG